MLLSDFIRGNNIKIETKIIQYNWSVDVFMALSNH